MKPMVTVGIIVLVSGLAALAYQGITFRSGDTVLDVGPLHATAVREHFISLSPIVGVVGIVGGVGLLVAGIRKKV